MKYLQLQKDILGSLHKEKQKKLKNEVLMKAKADGDWWITNGYWIYRLPESERVIELEHVKEYKNLEEMIMKSTGLSDVVDMKVTKGLDSVNAKVFEGDDMLTQLSLKITLHVNERFFKYFNEDMTYKAYSDNSPLYCYEHMKLMALLLPIRMAGK